MNNSIVNKVKGSLILFSIYRILMNFILKILRVFIKKDNNLILFVSYGGRYYNDSPRCIYELMRHDERFANNKLVWAFRTPSDYPEVPNKVKIDTLTYFITAIKARCWITNVVIERGLDFKGNNNFYFCTSHGNLPKLTGYDAKDKVSIAKNFIYRYDFYVAQTEYDRNLLPRMYGLRIEQTEACGFPKNDRLSNVSTSEMIEIRKKLGIPESKKVILYAPTFRGAIHGQMDCNVDFKKWESLLGPDYMILYRAHPVMASIANIDKKSKFVMDVSSYPDNNDLMIAADILISDYSGIYFEFGVQNKNVFCYAYDYEQYTKEWGLYFDVRKEIPGGMLNEAELLQFIKSEDSQKLRNDMQAFRDKYINADGNATQRCLDIICEHIK